MLSLRNDVRSTGVRLSPFQTSQTSQTAKPPQPSLRARTDRYDGEGASAYQKPQTSSEGMPKANAALAEALQQQHLHQRMSTLDRARAGGQVKVEVSVETEETAAARKLYEKKGDTKFDLKDPKQREELIKNSPQIDNVDGTKNDNKRCGGAAAFNALMLDGNNTKNAQAILRTASESRTELTQPQKEALTAYARGKMSPKQAAHMQEALLRIGTRMPTGKHPSGQMTDNNLNELAHRLKKHGGFASTRSVNFRFDSIPGGNNHITTTLTKKDGTQLHANSAPNKRGHATVKTSGNTSPITDGKLDKRFQADVNLEFKEDGTSAWTQRRREDDRSYMEWTGITPARRDVDLDTFEEHKRTP